MRKTIHFVIPPKPANTDELSDEDLEKVAGGTSHRVRIVLELKGLATSRSTTCARASSASRLLSAQPAGPVAAARRRRGAISQSLAIIEYLDRIRPPPLLPKDRGRAGAGTLVRAERSHARSTRSTTCGCCSISRTRSARPGRARLVVPPLDPGGLRGLERCCGDTETGRFCHGDRPTWRTSASCRRWSAPTAGNPTSGPIRTCGVSTTPAWSSRRSSAPCRQASPTPNDPGNR